MKNVLKNFVCLFMTALMMTMMGCCLEDNSCDIDLCGDDAYEYEHDKETREAQFYTCDELSSTTSLYWLKVKYAGQPTITIYPTDTTLILRDVPKTGNIELKAYYRKANMSCPRIKIQSIGAPLAGGEEFDCWNIYYNEQERSASSDYCAIYLTEVLKPPLSAKTTIEVNADCNHYGNDINVKLEYAE